MTYRVLNNEDLNVMNPNKSATRYADIVEGTLNHMESMGFLLVDIEQAPDENGEPYYVFHRTKN